MEKTLQQNYNNYMDAIKKTIDKHAPLKTKTKTKKDHNPGSTRINKSSKLDEGWLRKDGSNLNNMRTSLNISISTQYIRSTYITPRKHIY